MAWSYASEHNSFIPAEVVIDTPPEPIPDEQWDMLFGKPLADTFRERGYCVVAQNGGLAVLRSA